MFLIFAGETYYPIGGFKDFIGFYLDKKSMIKKLKKLKKMNINKSISYDWIQIVDSNTLKIIKYYYYDTDKWMSYKKDIYL